MTAYANALALEQPSYLSFDVPRAAAPTYAHAYSRCDYALDAATPNTISRRRASVLAASRCRRRSRQQTGAATACAVVAGACLAGGIVVAAVSFGVAGAALLALAGSNADAAETLSAGPAMIR